MCETTAVYKIRRRNTQILRIRRRNVDESSTVCERIRTSCLHIIMQKVKTSSVQKFPLLVKQFSWVIFYKWYNIFRRNIFSQNIFRYSLSLFLLFQLKYHNKRSFCFWSGLSMHERWEKFDISNIYILELNV